MPTRKFTEEHRRKLSEAHKGQVSWRKGKKFVDPIVSKEKRKEYVKKWKVKNKDKILELGRNWAKKNRKKISEQARLRYQKNPQKELDRIRFKKYGITGEEFRAILEKQGISCPICGKTIGKNLSVDHNHITGKVRGVICNKCNLAIGNAEDSPDRLRAMANYLEKNI